MEENVEYREEMVKQKEEHEKLKKEQGDSDLLFNEKDNKKSNKKK